MNTAVSFATTTTWQAYAGETTMSYFSQLAGLTAQNFLAGAAGLAVGIAFIRGPGARAYATRQLLGRSGAGPSLGAPPVSLVGASCWSGRACRRPEARQPSIRLAVRSCRQPCSMRGANRSCQAAISSSRKGPVATLEFIKNLGTNGGGFFNANGAHPVREPDAADQHARDAGDCGRAGRLDLHIWPDGRAAAPGVAALWVMVILFAAGFLCGWAEDRATRGWPRSVAGRRRSTPAAIWKARRFGSASGDRC